MTFEKQTKEIRACCRALLEQDKADVILGYTMGGLEGLSVPFFARNPEDTDKLTWGNRCWQNLAAYLHGRKDRIGIVAKPCDARGIIQYIIERQIIREQVYIIGVDCGGMIDAEGNPRPGCNACRVRIPPLFDTRVIDDRISQIKENAKTQTQVYTPERFQHEIDKCILCYACRQVCYGCYCQTCFIERGNPDWLPAEIDSGTKKTFHLGRAMHLAGRCVECGGCEAACASGVSLRYIIKALTGFVEKNYSFQAGMDLSIQSPMVSYEDNDKEIGFLAFSGGDEV